MRKLRVLVILDRELMPPDSLKGYSDQEAYRRKTEFDVVSTLKEIGHDVRPLGVADELRPIREAIEEWKPHVVFNLLVEFQGEVIYDQNVVSYLELMRVPYTGCNPRGMVLARGKDLSKQLLTHHRVPVPRFAVFPIGRKIARPRRLGFPLIVKSLTEDSSFGIAQASVVRDDDKLAERVRFVHESVGTAAIVEEYIEGREIYVCVLGNERLRVLPIWELHFTDKPGSLPIATQKVKLDLKYQEQRGIETGPAKNLAPEVQTKLVRYAKRACRTLQLDGYVRIDFRLTEAGVPYFLEANPIPDIARMEEFADAAKADGMDYRTLLNRILALGIARAKAGMSRG